MRLMRAPGILLGTAALIIACGGGSSGGEGGATSNTFAVQYCDLTGGVCCPKQGQAYSGEFCRALVALGGVQEGVTYDAAAGEQCLGALRAAQGQPTFCIDLGGPSVKPICDGAFKRSTSGTKKPGDTCERDSECAPDPSGEVECQFFDSSKHTCRLQVRAKEGDDCGGDKLASRSSSVLASNESEPARVNVCWEADGLYCSFEGVAGDGKKLCRKRGAIDGACQGGEPNGCMTGAFCETRANKCLALGAIGADCPGSSRCVEGAYCDPATNKCIATVPPGGACAKNIECGGTFGSCTNGKCQGGNLGVSLFFCSQ